MSQRIGEYIRKIDVVGSLYCIICNKEIKYGSAGCVSIEKHIHGAKHVEKFKEVLTNRKLIPQNVEVYALPPGLSTVEANIKKDFLEPSGLPSVNERMANQSAMLISFVAEHSLDLGMPSQILSLTKSLSRDSKALENLEIERTSATYKLTFGVGKTFNDRTIMNTRQIFFL